MVTAVASALEGTIIISALPTISEVLGGGDAYIWVPNAYLLASVAVLPLFAQASNIFGRRLLLLAAVAIFTFGSGLCGGARSMSMLIAARTIQSFGGGGINLLIETLSLLTLCRCESVASTCQLCTLEPLSALQLVHSLEASSPTDLPGAGAST